MIAPTFYTLPGNEAFVPTAAHPGEDVGGDIRACLPSPAIPSNYGNSNFYTNYTLDQGASFFVDGKEQPYNFSLYDFRELVDRKETVLLAPGQTALINSGFKIFFPSLKDLWAPWSNFLPYYQIVSRSGLAHKHKVVVTNSPGIIDCGYQDWIKVSLTNSGKDYHVFTHGTRIAQGIYGFAFDQSLCGSTTDSSIFEESQRATGGFGSTALT